MRIIVLLKQAQRRNYGTCEVNERIVQYEGEQNIGYDDGNALEMALAIKDRKSEGEVEIIALSMGPPKGEAALREALALGVDQACLVTDPALEGADTVVTARCLAAAIRKIGAYDIVLAGFKSADGKTGNVGPMVAECLNIPQITYVNECTVKDGKVEAKTGWNDHDLRICAALPCCLIINKKRNTLRGMTLQGVRRAMKMCISHWSLNELGCCGNAWQSKTVVLNRLENHAERKHIIMDLRDDNRYEERQQLTELLQKIKSGYRVLL